MPGKWETFVTDNGSDPPSDRETKERIHVVESIEAFLKEIFPDEDSILVLFGSSNNGFITKKADINLSLTFEGRRNTERFSKEDVVDTLGKGFHGNRSYYKARVVYYDSSYPRYLPRVRFGHVKSKVECEMSVYNKLGQYTSKLILTYKMIDRRFAVLGYAMKHLAKVCQIDNVSKGSLTSYAYLLMVIYYLQRTDPPVLPVLQELHTGEKPSSPLDGCEVWFFENLEMLKESGKFEFSANGSSAAELWIDMLEFYAEKFDYEKLTIAVDTIRDVEKVGDGHVMSIRDPFDVKLEVCSNLSEEMFRHIKKVFRAAWERFTTEIRSQKDDTIVNYYFNFGMLTSYIPVMEVVCRGCGDRHKEDECPESFSDTRDGRPKKMYLPPKSPPPPDAPGQRGFLTPRGNRRFRGRPPYGQRGLSNTNGQSWPPGAPNSHQGGRARGRSGPRRGNQPGRGQIQPD